MRVQPPAASPDDSGIAGTILAPLLAAAIFGGLLILMLVVPDTRKALDLKLAGKMASLPSHTLWSLVGGAIALGQMRERLNPVVSWICLPIVFGVVFLASLGMHHQKRDKGEL